MSKSARSFPRPLSEFSGALLGGALKAQGFASTELIARWAEIAGAEIAACSEPIKITWPRTARPDDVPEPATLVLRVEGPAAIEIQHLSGLILERVNRFFGWRAVGRLSLRQAPVKRREARGAPPSFSAEAAARIADTLPQIEDDDLRRALGRLGAAVKQK